MDRLMLWVLLYFPSRQFYLHFSLINHDVPQARNAWGCHQQNSRIKSSLFKERTKDWRRITDILMTKFWGRISCKLVFLGIDPIQEGLIHWLFYFFLFQRLRPSPFFRIFMVAQVCLLDFVSQLPQPLLSFLLGSCNHIFPPVRVLFFT